MYALSALHMRSQKVTRGQNGPKMVLFLLFEKSTFDNFSHLFMRKNKHSFLFFGKKMFINIFFHILKKMIICLPGLCQKKKTLKKYWTYSFHMKSNETLYVNASSDSIWEDLNQNCGRVFFFLTKSIIFSGFKKFFFNIKIKDISFWPGAITFKYVLHISVQK